MYLFQHSLSAHIVQIIEAKTKETHLVMWEPAKANHQNFANPAGRPCSSCTIVAGWHSQLYQSANLLHTTKIQHVYSAALQTQQGNIRAEIHPKIKGTSQSAGSLKLDRDNTQPILSHYNPDYKIRCLLVSVTKQVPWIPTILKVLAWKFIFPRTTLLWFNSFIHSFIH